MRLKALLSGDIKFQYKYGFYFLYLLFSVLYIGLLLALPRNWREKTAILMILTDPAAMGIFFMGAIVLLEKSERVLDTIAISPVKPFEYVASKLISIALISTAAGIVIRLSSSTDNIFLPAAAIFLTSCLFSSIGLMVASRVNTLNRFFIAVIPVELFVFVPAVAYLFGYERQWLLFHPGVDLIEINIKGEYTLPAFAVLLLWMLSSAALCSKTASKMLQSVGGVKL